MTTRLDVERGTEHLLPFAKKKLAELDGLDIPSRYISVSTGGSIFVCKGEVGLIRIRGGVTGNRLYNWSGSQINVVRLVGPRNLSVVSSGPPSARVIAVPGLAPLGTALTFQLPPADVGLRFYQATPPTDKVRFFSIADQLLARGDEFVLQWLGTLLNATTFTRGVDGFGVPIPLVVDAGALMLSNDATDPFVLLGAYVPVTGVINVTHFEGVALRYSWLKTLVRPILGFNPFRAFRSFTADIVSRTYAGVSGGVPQYATGTIIDYAKSGANAVVERLQVNAVPEYTLAGASAPRLYEFATHEGVSFPLDTLTVFSTSPRTRLYRKFHREATSVPFLGGETDTLQSQTAYVAHTLSAAGIVQIGAPFNPPDSASSVLHNTPAGAGPEEPPGHSFSGYTAPIFYATGSGFLPIGTYTAGGATWTHDFGLGGTVSSSTALSVDLDESAPLLLIPGLGQDISIGVTRPTVWVPSYDFMLTTYGAALSTSRAVATSRVNRTSVISQGTGVIGPSSANDYVDFEIIVGLQQTETLTVTFFVPVSSYTPSSVPPPGMVFWHRNGPLGVFAFHAIPQSAGVSTRAQDCTKYRQLATGALVVGAPGYEPIEQVRDRVRAKTAIVANNFVSEELLPWIDDDLQGIVV